MYDIVCIGDLIRDIFIKPHEAELGCPTGNKTCLNPFLCLEYGSKITIDEVNYEVGGGAANTSVAFSKMGLNSAVLSLLGNDYPAQVILERLEDEGVSTKLIKINSKIQTRFSIIITFRQEKTILVYRLNDYSVLKIPKKLPSKWLYLSPLGKGYEEIYKSAIALASEKNLKIALNPGTIQIQDGTSKLRSILNVSDILILNKKEAIDLVKLPGLPRPREILKSIHLLGAKIVVMTDGIKGSCAYDGEKFYETGIYPGQVVETTGAGDSFASAFITAIIEGTSILEALRWGAVNASSVVGKVGAHQGLLTKEEIRRRVKEHRWQSISRFL
jgi:sugar/nucleoside kinase (ribokinase family)